jgi:hypothetical protein
MSDQARSDPHELRDQEKLALHRHIADLLLRDPEVVIARAKANLARWRDSMGSQPYYLEWEDLLARLSPEDVASLITRNDAEGRRLRQSTPFVGVVPPEVRKSIFGEE